MSEIQHIKSSVDNPYYDYYNYIHSMKMDTDEYFNEQIYEKYKLKFDYYVSKQQLDFLEWEYEHRKSYIPLFKKRLKSYRLEMIIAVIFASIVTLVSIIMLLNMYAGFPQILAPLYFAFFIGPSVFYALKKVFKYLLESSHHLLANLAEKKQYISIAKQKMLYESELLDLQNEIFITKDISERLYEKALPYLSDWDKKFMETDFEVDIKKDNHLSLYEISMKMQQNLLLRNSLEKEINNLKPVYKKQKEFAVMSFAAMIISGLMFAIALQPITTFTFSIVLVPVLFIVVLLPIYLMCINTMFNYFNSPIPKNSADNESKILTLNIEYEDLELERIELEKKLEKELNEESNYV